MSKRDFLTLMDLTPSELNGLINRAIELKQMHAAGELYQPLKGKTLAMMFEKSSTRTRVSFEVAMAQFGGHALFLPPRDTQLGRGEPVRDSAIVTSRMVDAIMVRNHSHDLLEEMAKYSTAPVINGLTNLYHPCQLLADMQTYLEYRGSIQGKRVAWIGDGNNMCHSYINAARQFDFELHIASPRGYLPEDRILNKVEARIELCNTAQEAAKDADLIVTDVWASMGDEQEQNQRRAAFVDYQVNENILSLAAPDAVFMHCLPAHRGEEVTATVIDGAQSVIWDEAENRLHAQKALLEFLLI